jgi:hypothetical protein
MASINLFGTANIEGRLDVARALGSTATAMYIYDLAPGQSSGRITTSTKRSGCSSSTVALCCAHRRGSARCNGETSFGSLPVLPVRTRSRTGPSRRRGR